VLGFGGNRDLAITVLALYSALRGLQDGQCYCPYVLQQPNLMTIERARNAHPLA